MGSITMLQNTWMLALCDTSVSDSGAGDSSSISEPRAQPYISVLGCEDVGRIWGYEDMRIRGGYEEMGMRGYEDVRIRGHNDAAASCR